MSQAWSWKHPAGIPYGVAILYIIVVSVAVVRHVVVAVSGEAQELCILIEAVAPQVFDTREKKFSHPR